LDQFVLCPNGNFIKLAETIGHVSSHNPTTSSCTQANHLTFYKYNKIISFLTYILVFLNLYINHSFSAYILAFLKLNKVLSFLADILHWYIILSIQQKLNI